MDATKLSQLVKKQGLDEIGLISELDSLTKEYPYFATAYTLKIKALALNGSNWKEILPLVAIHVPQRDRLYKFINDIPMDMVDQTIEVQAEAVDVKQEKQTVLTENVDTEKVVEVKLSTEIEEPIKSVDLEKTIIAADLEEQMSDNQEEESYDEKIHPLLPVTNEGLLILDEETESETEEIISKDIEPVKKVHKTHRKPASLSGNDILSDEYDPDASSNDPIDKFLIKQPGAIRADDNLDMPKPIENEYDTKEEDIPASEPLAKIYAQQGHYEKAIVIYEKLRLKNPGKSSYFAVQIEKLGKKIQ